MSAIEIGEYVRNESGYIHKIDSIDKLTNFYIDEENNVREWVGETVLGNDISEKIVKHSKNIIDLIEVGDVIEVYFPIKQITKKVFADKYFKDSLILDGIIQERIILKTILTHEMYERNCYEVEE